MHIGGVGCDRQRRPVACRRLLQPAQILEHDRQVAVRIGVAGLDRQGLGNKFYRFLAVPHLVGDDAQQMQGDRLAGIGLHDPPVDALGLGQAVGRVVLHGKVQVRLPRRRGCRLSGRISRQAPFRDILNAHRRGILGLIIIRETCILNFAAP